jgi:outer membrane scaffolding protein for murein synthesis (MipA/OmpV family)
MKLYIILIFILIFNINCIANEKNISKNSLKKRDIPLNVGIATVVLPQYLGSDQSYKLVFPYLEIEFKNFSLDKDSSIIKLYKNDKINIRIAVSGRLPVKSNNTNINSKNNDYDFIMPTNKNNIRVGMPNLETTLFVGTEIELKILENINLKLPLLYGVPVNNLSNNIGNIFSPTIKVNFLSKVSTKRKFTFYINILFGDKKYNNYYYGINEFYSNINRKEFLAKQGLVASSYGLMYEITLLNKYKIGCSYFTHDMSNSIVKDSPLVINKKSSTLALYLLKKF